MPFSGAKFTLSSPSVQPCSLRMCLGLAHNCCDITAYTQTNFRLFIQPNSGFNCKALLTSKMCCVEQ